MITPQHIANYGYCPRRRLLANHFRGVGIEPARLPLDEAVNGVVGPILSDMLDKKQIPMTIDDAVALASARFSQAVGMRGGLKLQPTEDARYVFLEQGALIEALIRAFARVVVPDFEFANPEIPEKRALALGDGVDVVAAPDLILNYENGRCGLFWKFLSSYNEPDVWSMRHRIVPAVIAHDLQLVEIRYVKKGPRKASAGKWTQYSPLIRAYTNHRVMKWEKPNKNWEPFGVWNHHLGVKGWIERLPKKMLLEQFGMDWAATDLEDRRLGAYKYNRGSIDLVQMISAGEREAWKRQVKYQEALVRYNVAAYQEYPERQRPFVADQLFPQWRHSSKYCDLREACDQMMSDPTESGLFRLKGASA